MLLTNPSNPAAKAPKARPIPAWGVAPCIPGQSTRGLKARPINLSIPQIFLVAFHPILLQERPKLILKRTLCVMRLLAGDVLDQRLQIRRPHRKSSISPLPRELRQRWRLCLKPFRRGRLQLRNQLRDICGARQSNGKMHVVRDTPHAIAFAPGVAHNCSQISMKVGPHRIIENRPAILRTEDHVHQNERKREWHRRDYMSGLQPSLVTHNTTWGFTPCWYSVAPSALWRLAATILSGISGIA
jgi:hypothetical protein